eukprot:8580037-Pyramimonas_sp.AAC.1
MARTHCNAFHGPRARSAGPSPVPLNSEALLPLPASPSGGALSPPLSPAALGARGFRGSPPPAGCWEVSASPHPVGAPLASALCPAPWTGLPSAGA